MARRVPRVGALSAAAALVASSLLLVPAAQGQELESAAPAQGQEPQGVGVTFFGHFCGPDDFGPKPGCTYTPKVDHSYGGTGPFTITVNGDVLKKCAHGKFCTDRGRGSIPAGATVTIRVTGEPGMVSAGSVS
jgi:hypothetical protein